MSEQPSLPGFDAMYEAMRERDPAFDGLFFTCVRTTGVFCRPTCDARKPRRENVEFVATSGEAQRAGYRPCRRCRPLEPPASHPAWALELISRVRASETRLTDRGLAALGLRPSRVRGYFRRRFGVTFQAFQRSQRMGEALRRLQGGQDGLGAGLDSGYESATSGRRSPPSSASRPAGPAA